jgi:hypothetical protein
VFREVYFSDSSTLKKKAANIIPGVDQSAGDSLTCQLSGDKRNSFGWTLLIKVPSVKEVIELLSTIIYY